MHQEGKYTSLSLSKSKLCVRNQCTTCQLDRWREISPVNTAKTRFSTKIHFVSSLSLPGEQLKLSFPHSEYLLFLDLSQCNLSDMTVAQQQQNVSFPMLWGIYSPGNQNSLPSWTAPQSIPTPTQHSFMGFYHPVVLSQPEKESAFRHEVKKNFWPSQKEVQGALQSWTLRKPWSQRVLPFNMV